MAEFIILSPKVSDTATLTASTEDTGTPVENLQDDQPRVVWKTTSDASQYIVLDFGSVKTFDYVYLGFTNLTSSATARIRSADTEADLTTAPDFDSTSFTALTEANPADYPLDRGHLFYPLSSAQSNRWVRIDLDDASNPDTFISAGRLIVGEAWTPASYVKIQVPFTFGSVDDSPRQRRRDMGINVFQRPKYNKIQTQIFTRNDLSTDAQAEIFNNLDEIIRDRGSSAPLLLAIEPGTSAFRHKKLFYGLMDSQLLTLNFANGSAKRFRYTLNVEEMI